ncbi:MAG TPA: DUF4129 domain-containing protein [Streptosporangiaceae bacterium]|nr:DUF4129 domain-containing protein [Streptosporangiaceae bacterium]
MTHRLRSAAARGQLPDGGPAPRIAARLFLVSLLTAAVLVGARAAVPVADWNAGPWHGHGLLLAACLEAVFVTLLTILGRREERSQASQLAARLRLQLRTCLGAAVAVIPALVLLNLTSPTPVHLPRLLAPGVRPATAPAAAPSALLRLRPLLIPVLYAVLLTAVLTGVVAIALLLRGRRRGPARRETGMAPGSGERLHQAVRSGQAALRQVDDARRAIIACYVAMEHSLAEAGTVRGEAETPDELLARAAAAGLARQAEASQLTALFYEARFSSHPMPPERRDQARQALRVLAAGLSAVLSAQTDQRASAGARS